ncbi:benzoquinone reductase, partial [Amanita muscaria Koide BX008]
KIAIIISSMYGHIAKMAEAAKQSVEKAGGQASIFQIAENLSPDILAKMHSPPKPDYPIINLNDLTNYDGCLFGVPTR